MGRPARVTCRPAATTFLMNVNCPCFDDCSGYCVVGSGARGAVMAVSRFLGGRGGVAAA
jgi:hypothetical protein